MKQRLGIAQALLGDPALVILDEPTNGLDPHGTVEIRELIKRLSTEHKITFFVSSHLLHEVELICNRVSVLRRGRVVGEGYVRDLLRSEGAQLRVIVNDPETARALLVGQSWIQNVELAGDVLNVQTGEDRAADINKLLVQNDVLVKGISQVPRVWRHSLWK
ncbi:MAG: ABC transporter ATP-binding protein [Firmicutes bacterium]|nr:ABC transporter ATP-binding protein [Bacillota bacterium]